MNPQELDKTAKDLVHLEADDPRYLEAVRAVYTLLTCVFGRLSEYRPRRDLGREKNVLQFLKTEPELKALNHTLKNGQKQNKLDVLSFGDPETAIPIRHSKNKSEYWEIVTSGSVFRFTHNGITRLSLYVRDAASNENLFATFAIDELGVKLVTGAFQGRPRLAQSETEREVVKLGLSRGSKPRQLNHCFGWSSKAFQTAIFARMQPEHLRAIRSNIHDQFQQHASGSKTPCQRLLKARDNTHKLIDEATRIHAERVANDQETRSSKRIKVFLDEDEDDELDEAQLLLDNELMAKVFEDFDKEEVVSNSDAATEVPVQVLPQPHAVPKYSDNERMSNAHGLTQNVNSMPGLDHALNVEIRVTPPHHLDDDSEEQVGVATLALSFETPNY